MWMHGHKTPSLVVKHHQTTIPSLILPSLVFHRYRYVSQEPFENEGESAKLFFQEPISSLKCSVDNKTNET